MTVDRTQHPTDCTCRFCDAERRHQSTQRGLEFWRRTGYGRLEIRLGREPNRQELANELNRMQERIDALEAAMKPRH